MEKDNFDLTAQEFDDALAIRDKKPLLNIPLHCEGCGFPSSLDHFLICRNGGLIQLHNEVRNVIGNLAALAWDPVKREPIVKDGFDGDSDDVLIADLCVRDV